MARFEIIYPEGHKLPNTGISKGAQKVSKGAEALRNALPSFGELGRNVARTATRAGEAILGAPADLATGALGLGALAEQVTQGEPQLLSQLHGAASRYLPTSENIRKYGTEKVSEKILPEGYLNPQSKNEQRWDSFVDTVASLGSPLLGSAKVGLKVASKLGLSNEFAKWGAEKLGLGEAGQAVAGAGAMLATSLAGAPRMVEYAGSLFDKSKAAAKTAKPYPAQTLENVISETRKDLQKGSRNKAKGIAEEFLQDIESKIDPVTKKIPLEEIAQLKQDINANIYKSSNKAEVKAASEYLYKPKSELINIIKDSAKDHPEFANNLLAADEIWAALKNEDMVSNFLQKYIKSDINELKSPLTTGFLTALGGAAITPVAPKLGGYIAAGGAGLVGYTGYKAAQVFMKSGQARKYYSDLVKSALHKNVPATLKNIRKLDHIFSVEDEAMKQGQGRYEIVYPS